MRQNICCIVLETEVYIHLSSASNDTKGQGRGYLLARVICPCYQGEKDAIVQ